MAGESLHPLDKLLDITIRFALLKWPARHRAHPPEHMARSSESISVPHRWGLALIRAGLSSCASARRFPRRTDGRRRRGHRSRTIGEVVREDQWLTASARARVPRTEGGAALPRPTHALVQAVRTAHANVHRSDPGVVHGSATSDARFYLNQAGMPAVCYGPRTRKCMASTRPSTSRASSRGPAP